MKGAVFLLGVLAVTLLNLLQITNAAAANTAPPVPVPGDLRGKMFTLSPTDTVTLRSLSPGSPYTGTNTGVSVCLRYIAEGKKQTMFTLSPSSRSVDNKLKFEASSGGYSLAYQRISTQHALNFQSFRPFFDNEGTTKLWTSICVVVDTKKGVAQVFNGKTASVRKRLPTTDCTWDGEQALAIRDFEGQITDLQMWDYPLPDAEAQQYLTHFRPSDKTATWTRPAVVSWSRIRADSATGAARPAAGGCLLEDAYPIK